MKKKTKKKVRAKVNLIVDSIFAIFLLMTFILIGCYISWAASTLLAL